MRQNWVTATLVAASVISLADGILLQLRRDFFTGGFLSEDAATTWASRLLFGVCSLIVDAGAAAPLAWGAAWLLGGWPARRGLRTVVVAALAALPFLFIDVVSYEIVRFLGDTFDAGLMFDLVGRRLDEVAVVMSGQWGRVAALALSAVTGAALVMWLFVRARRSAAVPGGARLPRQELTWVALLALVGLVVCVLGRLVSPVVDNGLRRKPSGRVGLAVVATLSDVDRDGFGWTSPVADPWPFDGTRHPYAIDVPGNAVDENGLAGDLPDGATSPAAAEPRPFARTPPVMLVVLESVRADVVGLHVNGRPVTPTLDALARAGLSHPRAYSHNGYTVQSRYHLMAGSLVNGFGGALLDDFARNGYETAYFSGQDESFGISGARFDSGFARADVRYDARQDRERRASTYSTPGSLLVPGTIVLERLAAFLAGRGPSRPLFLVLGIGDTHFPYAHSDMEPLLGVEPLPRADIVPERRNDLLETYAQAVSNVDATIGKAMSLVEAHTGVAPAVVVVSDHGESLFDEGFLGHGYALNDAQTRVPLVTAGLDLQLPDPFGQADLRASLLAALSRPASSTGPRLVPRGDLGVVQYLGVFERARQLAVVGTDGRASFDLRTGMWRDRDGPARAVTGLSGRERDTWRQLVHFWERSRLSEAAARSDSSR